MDTASSLVFRHGRRVGRLLAWGALAWFVLLQLALLASGAMDLGLLPSADPPRLAPIRWAQSFVA